MNTKTVLIPSLAPELTVLYRGTATQQEQDLAWAPVFESLAEVFSRYRRSAGEVAWNWAERPMVGFLSAAVWLAGGTTIEEHAATKAGKTDGRTRVPGRADLWVCLGNRSWGIEAKQAKVLVQQPQTHVAVVASAAAAARRGTWGFHERAAVAFLALTLEPGARSAGPLDTHREAAHADELLRSFLRGFVVHYLPDRADLPPATPDRYVGLTMVLGIEPRKP